MSRTRNLDNLIDYGCQLFSRPGRMPVGSFSHPCAVVRWANDPAPKAVYITPRELVL
jgi:hypothetical protein